MLTIACEQLDAKFTVQVTGEIAWEFVGERSGLVFQTCACLKTTYVLRHNKYFLAKARKVELATSFCGLTSLKDSKVHHHVDPSGKGGLGDCQEGGLRSRHDQPNLCVW